MVSEIRQSRLQSLNSEQYSIELYSLFERVNKYQSHLPLTSFNISVLKLINRKLAMIPESVPSKLSWPI